MGLSNVKEVYTQQEWKQKEQYYISKCNTIAVPIEPTTKDVMRLTSEIDDVLGEALVEMAYVKRKFQDYKAKLGIVEKETFVSLKQTYIAQGSKPTEAELKGLVASYLSKTPVMSMPRPVFEMVTDAENRFIFMESILKLLEAKKGALVTDNGMMKLEAAANGIRG